jgi:hypothetical protein
LRLLSRARHSLERLNLFIVAGSGSFGVIGILEDPRPFGLDRATGSGIGAPGSSRISRMPHMPIPPRPPRPPRWADAVFEKSVDPVMVSRPTSPQKTEAPPIKAAANGRIRILLMGINLYSVCPYALVHGGSSRLATNWNIDPIETSSGASRGGQDETTDRGTSIRFGRSRRLNGDLSNFVDTVRKSGRLLRVGHRGSLGFRVRRWAGPLRTASG